jgi:hypothetical protein
MTAAAKRGARALVCALSRRVSSAEMHAVISAVPGPTAPSLVSLGGQFAVQGQQAYTTSAAATNLSKVPQGFRWQIRWHNLCSRVENPAGFSMMLAARAQTSEASSGATLRTAAAQTVVPASLLFTGQTRIPQRLRNSAAKQHHSAHPPLAGTGTRGLHHRGFDSPKNLFEWAGLLFLLSCSISAVSFLLKMTFGAVGLVLNFTSTLVSAAIVVGGAFAAVTMLRGKSVAKELKKVGKKLK